MQRSLRGALARTALRSNPVSQHFSACLTRYRCRHTGSPWP